MSTSGQARLFAKYAFEKRCVARALKVALIVGTVLALINHFDSIASGSLDAAVTFQILLTYTVPYSVSTFSSAMQALQMDQDQRPEKPNSPRTGNGASELAQVEDSNALEEGKHVSLKMARVPGQFTTTCGTRVLAATIS